MFNPKSDARLLQVLKINELESVSQFEDLQGVWTGILEKTEARDIFSTWEWLWCWWKYFGKERNARILVVQEKNEIFGLAPLMLSKYSFLRLGKLHKLEFIGSPHSDYNKFILLKKERECLKLFLKHFMEFSDWDLLELRDIREGCVSAYILQEVCNSQISRLKLKVDTVCPYVNLPVSMQVFMNSLSRNMRKNLRRRMRRLREEYKVEVKTQRDFNSVKEAMEVFYKLHQERWRSRAQQGAFASKAFRDFHLHLARIFDEKGWLALYFLTADDEPIAAVYSFDYNQKKYGYLTGFNPDFESYGVGNLLKLHIIEECIKNGYREYDLTRGFEPYKADWATEARKNFVARMVYKNGFANVYNWAVQNGFCRLLIERFGGHLSVERS